MGWSSWNAFNCRVTEAAVRNVSDLLISSGLAAAGFQFVNLDDCVFAPSRDNVTGALLPSHSFPSGFAALASSLHSRGLLFGMYSDAGFRTCQGLPGLLDSEDRDAAQFAAIGVDLIKNDGCFTGSPRYKGWPGPGIPQPGAYEKAARMFQALRATGRPIIHYIQVGTSPLLARSVSNMRRCGGDIGDSFGSIVGSFLGCYNGGGAPLSDVGPGFWNDADSLEVGNGGQTLQEYTTHFAMWCVGKMPLILGFDLANPRCKDCSAADIFGLLLNTELIGVNQDDLGIPAVPRGGAFLPNPDNGVFVSTWAGPLKGGAWVLMLLNTGAVNATLASLDLGTVLNATRGTVLQCRDLLRRVDCGQFEVGRDNFTTPVPSHGSVVVRLWPASGGDLDGGWRPTLFPTVWWSGSGAPQEQEQQQQQQQPYAEQRTAATSHTTPPPPAPPSAWPMRGFDARHSGASPLAGPTTCAPLWSLHNNTDHGGAFGAECTPALSASGYVLAPLNSGPTGPTLFALNGDTGAIVWQLKLNGTVWATPLVCAAPGGGGGELAIIGSQQGGVVAVSVASGTPLWTALSGALNSVIFSSVTTLDAGDPAASLWVGSWDNHLYELDRGTGSVLSALPLGTEVRSTPALLPLPGGGVAAYLSVGRALVCARRSGGAGTPPLSIAWALNTTAWAYASPSLSGDGATVFFPNSGDATARALDAATGRVKWEAFLGVGADDSAQGALFDGTYFVVARGGLVALREDTGAQLWGRPARGGGNSALTVDAGGVVWMITGQNGLLGVNGSTGEVGLECGAGTGGEWGTSGTVVEIGRAHV